jgi:hypothetical protein
MNILHVSDKGGKMGVHWTVNHLFLDFWREVLYSILAEFGISMKHIIRPIKISLNITYSTAQAHIGICLCIPYLEWCN